MELNDAVLHLLETVRAENSEEELSVLKWVITPKTYDGLYVECGPVKQIFDHQTPSAPDENGYILGIPAEVRPLREHEHNDYICLELKNNLDILFGQVYGLLGNKGPEQIKTLVTVYQCGAKTADGKDLGSGWLMKTITKEKVNG